MKNAGVENGKLFFTLYFIDGANAPFNNFDLLLIARCRHNAAILKANKHSHVGPMWAPVGLATVELGPTWAAHGGPA